MESNVHCGGLKYGPMDGDVMLRGPRQAFFPSNDPGEIEELSIIASPNSIELQTCGASGVTFTGSGQGERHVSGFQRHDFKRTLRARSH